MANEKEAPMVTLKNTEDKDDKVKNMSALIGKIMGDLVLMTIFSVGLVNAFHVTWGQAFLLSWFFDLLRDSIRNAGK